jgi:galactonate dehydratase
MVSGIDIALWDIRGQALGLPVYELLGGPVRETVPLYVHFPSGPTPEQMAEGARGQVALGARAIKCDPFMSAGRPAGLDHINYLDGEIDAATEQVAVEMIAAVREAVGPQIDILIDAHARYNVPTAIRLATRLAPYAIGWFEEPVPPESYHALRQVRDQVPVRLCVGERLHTRFEFVPIFEQHLADYIMPDVTWTGGITELKKIATMAEAYYIPITPHDASGPINILAGAHVSLTVPNLYRLEARRARFDFYNAFLDEPLVVQDGALHVPRRPGLGLSLNMDYLRANEVGQD